MNYKKFFGDMNISEIKALFLENDFSKEEIKKIEMGIYNPYQSEDC